MEFELQDTEMCHKALNQLLKDSTTSCCHLGGFPHSTDISHTLCPKEGKQTSGQKLCGSQFTENMSKTGNIPSQVFEPSVVSFGSSEDLTQKKPSEDSMKRLIPSEKGRLDVSDVNTQSVTSHPYSEVNISKNLKETCSLIESQRISDGKDDEQDHIQPESSVSRPYDVAGQTGRWCMVGLHCCGDLTPTMLKAFLHTPHVTCLVSLSCCYHRMSHRQDPHHLQQATDNAEKHR